MSAETAKTPVPRFGLVVGQEMHFELLDGMWFDGPDGKPKTPREADGSPKYSRFDVTAYVTARNQDGSFRVLLSWNDEYGHKLISANLFADGQLKSSQGGDAQRLREIFPRLPDNVKELRDGWVDRDGPTAASTRYPLDGQESAPGRTRRYTTYPTAIPLFATTCVPRIACPNGYRATVTSSSTKRLTSRFLCSSGSTSTPQLGPSGLTPTRSGS